MAHTNSTTNYHLPQFLTTDKPAWLTDINTAFDDIDTAIKAAKDAGDDAQSDATQALSDASDANTAASAADAKGSGAVASIADTFSDASTYNVNQLVMYNNLLYICHTAVTTPGPWTGSANWLRKTIEEVLPDNAQEIFYNNHNSGLSAENVQTAIDEVETSKYYRQETVTVPETVVAGILWNSNKTLEIFVPLEKIIKENRTVTFDPLNPGRFYIYGPSSSSSAHYFQEPDLTIDFIKPQQHGIVIKMTSATAFLSGSNIGCTVWIDNMKISVS